MTIFGEEIQVIVGGVLKVGESVEAETSTMLRQRRQRKIPAVAHRRFPEAPIHLQLYIYENHNANIIFTSPLSLNYCNRILR